MEGLAGVFSGKLAAQETAKSTEAELEKLHAKIGQLVVAAADGNVGARAPWRTNGGLRAFRDRQDTLRHFTGRGSKVSLCVLSVDRGWVADRLPTTA
jgi:hypothetical protein